MAPSLSPPKSPRRSVSRSPARRRRLIRRSHLPRSQTTSLLPSAHGTISGISASSGFLSLMTSAITSSCAEPTAPALVNLTPAPSTPSPTFDVRSRKPWLNDPFTSRECPATSPAPTPSSPLPDLPISPKAAKLLGFDVDEVNTESPVVRRSLLKKPSFQSLGGLTIPQAWSDKKTKLKEEGYVGDNHFVITVGDKKKTRFKEEDLVKDDECNPSVATASAQKRLKKINWKEGNRKTARLLDFMPSIYSRSKSAERGVDVTLPGPETEAEEQYIDVGYSSDSEMTMARPVPMWVATPQKKYKAHKKKYGKHLEPMSPITEADLTEGDAVEEDAIEEDAVLDAEVGNNEVESLFEYGTEQAYFGGGVLRRSITEPLFKPLLKEDDELFDSQDDEYGEEKGGEEDAIEALGQDVAKFKMSLHAHPPDTVQLESSLQNLERTLLNNQEEMMKVRAQTVWLKHQHLKMKRRFNELQERSFINDSHYINYVNDINNTKDTCNIDKIDDEYEESEDFENSLELDEPVFDTSKVVQFQKIAPGSVKLVDIGPLKSDKIVQVSKISPGQVKTVTLPRREKLDINTLSQNGAVPTVGLDEEGGNTNHPIDIQPDLADTSSDVRSSRSDKTVKKQPGFHRQKSRVLVQDWLDHNPIIMRPISEQIDPQVLTDQDKDRPPMPPRKDSIPSSNPKHHCILHGHIFQPINLKAVPDRALINNLEVHPYLMNREGVKEHVSVPVACDKCFNTVGDQFWECEIPVCRLAICYACAEQMESEWQDRAVTSWVRV